MSDLWCPQVRHVVQNKMKINLEILTIEKAHESLKKGEYTVTDLVNAYLEVIKEKKEVPAEGAAAPEEAKGKEKEKK